MQPKRKLPSASSSSPRKHKATGTQGSLDKFFSVPHLRSQRDNKSKRSPPSVGPSSRSEIIIISDDEKEEEVQFTRTGNSDTVVQLDDKLSHSEEKEQDRKETLPKEFDAGSRNKLCASTGSPTKKVLVAKTEYIAVQEYPALAVDAVASQMGVPPWKNEESAPYSFLAHALASVATTRSRIAILNILTNTLRAIILFHPQSLLPSLYLLSNSLAPPYIGSELGLGMASISKAIQTVSGLTPTALKQLYNKTGDPGDVAFEAKSNVRTLVPHPSLTIVGVYESLTKICNSKGDGASKRKQAIVERLLVAARGEEIRYLVRTLCQHIRVGAVRTSILTALARAMVLSRPKGIGNTIPPDDSPYFASPELLKRVENGLTQPASKGKRKANDDDASVRSLVIQKFSEAERLLKKVYVQHPNYDAIVYALLGHGMEDLSTRITLTVGIPLHHTLGSPTRSLDEVYERLNGLPFVAEFKYDGQRAQIHVSKSDSRTISVKVFSRHLEDMTNKYPDVVLLMQAIFSEDPEKQSAIIDSEIVAIDPVNGELRSFQELSARPRKDVCIENIQVPVCVFAFDLMYLNGQSMLEVPFRARRTRLHVKFPPYVQKNIADTPNAARFAHVECCESELGREKVEEFWQQAVESRSEGLMIKLLDSGDVIEEENEGSGRTRKKPLPATYEPDKRTSAWLKLKKDYVTGLGDSLDLVPIGAWHGNGRKAQWWSPILLALWDEGQGNFVGVCKCMSGFSDEFYKALNERYPEDSETCSRSPLWDCVTGGLTPEVYFKPQEVWECKGADITVSPVSVAAYGCVSSTRGLSVRFPRFIRVREDKDVQDASTPDFLVRLWELQESKGKTSKNMGEANDDGDLVDASAEESGEEEDAYAEL